MIIGPYCETGGISVHIRRLVRLLTTEFDVRVIDESRLKFSDGKTFNLRSKNFIEYIGLIYNSDVVHIHTSINWVRFLHVLMSKVLWKKVIVTLHSIMHVENKKYNVLLRSSLALANKTIVVNKKIKSEIGGVSGVVMPAFLPPVLENEDELPKQLEHILSKNKQKRLLVSNAYRLDWHNGNDLYGFDLLLEVAKTIKEKGIDLFIVLIISSVEENDPLLIKYNELIQKESLGATVVILPYSISFVKLILKSDMVIRATNTDGDSLTIREALHLKKPVIASDVVKRPNGTILFKNRDSGDLYAKIVANIDRPSSSTEPSSIDYKEIYSNLILN